MVDRRIPPQFTTAPHRWSRPLAVAAVAGTIVGFVTHLPIVLLLASVLLSALVGLNIRRYRRPAVMAAYLFVCLAVIWAGWWLAVQGLKRMDPLV